MSGTRVRGPRARRSVGLQCGSRRRGPGQGTTVDDPIGTGHVACLVGCQHHGRGGNPFGPSESPHRAISHELGHARIEGERLEFAGVECKFTDQEDAEAVNFTIKAETAHGPTGLWVSRAIGWNVGFDYEEELVQVSLLGGEFARISMAQNSGDENGGIRWHRGDGPDPLLAVVGTSVMATGTLQGHPGSESPLAGDFVMAANCS